MKHYLNFTIGNRPEIIELTLSISNYQNARCSILNASSMDDEKILSARFSDDKIAEYARDERRHHEGKLNKFLEQYDLSIESDNVHL